MRIRSILTLLCFVCGSSFVATAQQNASSTAGQDQTSAKSVSPPALPGVIAGEANAKELLRLMDTDKNGKVSREEFMAFMAAEFDRLDVNHDGELDVSELTKAPPRSVAGGHR